MKTLIIGAGMTGLSAARRLLERGLDSDDICIVEKSRAAGGRMASRRLQTNVGTARFDHGAQFFTARSEAFQQLLESAEHAGVIRPWTHGFSPTDNDHPRWCGSDGMTSLCKWMVTDSSLDVSFRTTVGNLGEYLKDQSFNAVIHTAPVPQALGTLNGSGLLPAPGIARQLADVQYHATVTVMLATGCHPTGLGADGAAQFVDHNDLAFIADNHAKGISTVPAVTIHLARERSESLWSAPDAEIVSFALQAAADQLGDAADPAGLQASSVQRWRYAEPINQLADGCVVWGDKLRIALAGEAFAQPRVEGAYTSGIAAADALLNEA